MARKQAPANDSFQSLKQDIQSGQFQRCYLLHGEEDYLRTIYCETLRKKLLDGPTAEFNFHRFSRENLDWDHVAEAVETMPMMAERTLVEVDDVDLYKEPEAAREKIIAILEDLPDYCCLVFHYDTIEFTQDKRLKKLHSAVERQVRIINFRKLSASDLRAWTRRQAVKGGKDIDNATCDYLAFVTDNSLSAMASELTKLTSYASGPVITVRDIDAMVEPTLTAVSFDISNAVCDGDYERALVKLRELLAMQQDPILLLGAVAAQIRRLQCAKVLSEHGKGADSLMKLCARGEYAARLTMTAARKLSSRFCGRAVLLCLETDRQMKSSYDDPARLLELLLLRLAQEAKA